MRGASALIATVTLLAACGQEEAEPEDAIRATIPESVQQAEMAGQPAEEAGIGTPMAERVATLGLLNKRNNVSRDFEMKPGKAVRVGDVVIRMEACEKTAPWEMPQEEGAFVQVFVRERRGNESEPSWQKVSSGWLFRNSPSLNVVEHPVYDVWVKKCAMSFPGEEDSAGED